MDVIQIVGLAIDRVKIRRGKYVDESVFLISTFAEKLLAELKPTNDPIEFYQQIVAKIIEARGEPEKDQEEISLNILDYGCGDVRHVR